MKKILLSRFQLKSFMYWMRKIYILKKFRNNKIFYGVFLNFEKTLILLKKRKMIVK
jgi:hypothetical protein